LSVAYAEDNGVVSDCHVHNGILLAFSAIDLVCFSPNGELELMQVMLLGHSDSYVKDKAMQVTIAFNHFGEGLIQRMPR
jgi:pectate lyase